MPLEEKQFAAIAPMLALMGIFIHPVASTLLPFICFFIFNWRRMDFAVVVALRAADLTFTIQIILILERFALAFYLDSVPTTQEQAQNFQFYFLVTILGVMVISLAIGFIQTLRGKLINYYVSLKIAERVFTSLTSKNRPS